MTTMREGERAARAALVAECRAMAASGLNQGTSGNLSLRLGDRMLITPSAVAAEALAPEMIACLALDGDGSWHGPLPPSSEWRLHRDILRARPEVGAVVHSHAPHATALAMARRLIPPCHYMVAAFGGMDVRVAPYATFGTAALAAHAVDALDGRNGCLLANHGAVTIGPTLARAAWLMVELEALARQYLLSLQAGGPVLLGEAEVAAAMAGFAAYGAGANGSSG